MSAAGQHCSIEINNSSSRSGDSRLVKSSTCAKSTTVSQLGGAAVRTSNVVVPRRTMKIATGPRAKAVAEKLANQTTVAGAFNSAADTVSASNVQRPVEALVEHCV
jgi:hypothetical protein